MIRTTIIIKYQSINSDHEVKIDPLLYIFGLIVKNCCYHNFPWFLCENKTSWLVIG